MLECERMTGPVVGMELAEIKELIGKDEPAYRARQVYEAVYRHRAASWEQITTLPAGFRIRMASLAPFGLPRVLTRYDSTDGARRYLLGLSDGRSVETVLMPEEGRDTLCLSTQVGCPVDCKFCLTALLGLERNLTAGEIVGQVLLVAAAHGLDPRQSQLNVVMMGQGEPLLNLPNVLKATRLLVGASGFGMSERRLTLSTAGIIPRIPELGRERVRPKLAISLNAST